MEEAAVTPVYDMLKDKEIIGAAPFLYERLKINESPVLTGGTDFNEVRKVKPLLADQWGNAERKFQRNTPWL